MVLTITVPNNDVNFFSSMIKLVYDSYQITHVKYNGENYFNCTNMWSGGKPQNDYFCHADIKCDGYSNCELEKTSLPTSLLFYIKLYKEISYTL